ncbi:hypothetical protein ACFLTB_07995, partial [Chloroflexota bacterium]
RAGRSYDEMIFGGAGLIGNMYNALALRGETRFGNLSYIDDPVVEEARNEMCTYSVTDQDRANAIHKELMKYVLDQAWLIPKVTSPQYHYWWPWVRNYQGEYGMVRNNTYSYAKYVWIDQDMKESMGY